MNYIKINTDTNEAEIILRKNIDEKSLKKIIGCLDNIQAIKINCRNITNSKIDTGLLSIIVRLCLYFNKQQRKVRLIKATKQLKESLKSLKLDSILLLP